MKKKNTIKILIADDHQMLLDGLRSLLGNEDNIHIVDEATNGQQVLDILGFDPVDVAVLDIAMPGMNGDQTVLEIKEKYPQTKIIILSLHKEEEIIRKFMDAGVSGYVIKDRGSEELVKAINLVANGEDYWDPEAVKILVKSEKNKTANANGEAPLTNKEKEIMHLIARGLPRKEISEKLYIAITTVDTHRQNILKKLDLKPNQLMLYAITKGYGKASLT